MSWKYISRELVAEIREYIKGDDLTIKEFAEDFLGCSDTTFHYILSDTKPMLVKHAVKLSELTGIDYNYILENTAFSQYNKGGGFSVTAQNLK